MARSELADVRGPLARALRKVAQSGSAGVLAPVWAEVVGPALASRSRPVRLSQGELTVTVAPEFAVDLRRDEAALRARLEARLGKGSVRRLLIQVEVASR